MIPIDVLGVFFVASVLLALSPGPDNIFVLTQSALSGPRAGLIVTIGLCTGLIVHTTAVAFGVAVIFQTSAVAFTALKVAGAAYLVYLAWQAFRSGTSNVDAEPAATVPVRRLYLRGIVMNVTNPKVSIFFLAFLPQFVDPARAALVPQIFLLGTAFAVATIIVFGAFAVFAGSIGRWLMRSERSQRVMNRVAGTVFLLLAARLLVAQRG